MKKINKATKNFFKCVHYKLCVTGKIPFIFYSKVYKLFGVYSLFYSMQIMFHASDSLQLNGQ